MYVFSGSGQYIPLPSGVSHLAGDHTICMWLIADVVATEKYITADWSATYRNYLYRITGSKFSAFSGNGSNAQASEVLSGTISTGTLYHVAFVRDGNTLRIYVNGAQVASGSITGYTGGNTSLNRRIGTDSTTNNPFDGMMEDFREYTRALSPAEILTIFRSGGHDGIVNGLELREPMDFLGTGWAQAEKKTFTIPTPGSYLYYRLLVWEQDDTTNALCIAEMELLDESDVDQTSGQTFSASGYQGTYTPAKAFDDVTSSYSYWLCDAAATPDDPQWIKVQFGEAKTINKLTLQARNFSDWQDMPVRAMLQGSNDDATWVDLVGVNVPFFHKGPKDIGPKKHALSLTGAITFAQGKLSPRRRRR